MLSSESEIRVITEEGEGGKSLVFFSVKCERVCILGESSLA